MRLEEEIFDQDDSFQQLQALKEHLMDEYANNRLSLSRANF